MRKIVICLLIHQLAGFQLYGQTKLIQGKILIAEPSYEKGVNSKFYTLQQTTIFSVDTIKIGTTNDEGIFELHVEDTTKTVLAGFIGYDFERIELSEQCEFYEVILMPDVIYDFVSAKKAARLRKKDRRILPELYHQAFEQGLIEKEKPCR